MCKNTCNADMLMSYQHADMTSSELSCAGATLTVELLLGWKVAFVASHNMRKKVVLRRSSIACFYTRHGNFAFDFISTCLFVAQVSGPAACCIACPK